MLWACCHSTVCTTQLIWVGFGGIRAAEHEVYTAFACWYITRIVLDCASCCVIGTMLLVTSHWLFNRTGMRTSKHAVSQQVSHQQTRIDTST